MRHRLAILASSLVLVASSGFVAFDRAVTRSWSVPVPLVAETALEPAIYGHRGARVPGIRENTMPAFEYARDNGANGIETDLQTSKDGYLVLFHDQLLAGRPISAYTYAQLRRRGVQRWLGVLRFARDTGLAAAWELKGTWTDAEVVHACTLVDAEGMADRSTMITNSLVTLAQLKRLCWEIPRGFISLKALLTPERAAALAPVYMPSVARLSTSGGAQYRAAGLELYVWTIRSRDDYLKARAAGASAVICDDVRLCRALRWVER